VYFWIASVVLLALDAALAALRASLPALKVRATVALASLIFLLLSSISLFFLSSSSRLALSAALSLPLPAALLLPVGADTFTALISSKVSLLPSPGVNRSSQSMSRPTLKPFTKFGDAVG